MPRQSKTTKALAVIVMGEIGLHDELKKEITGVTIRKTERHNPKAPNWEAVFETVGYSSDGRPIPMPVPHPLAYEIVSKLQSQFDAT